MVKSRVQLKGTGEWYVIVSYNLFRLMSDRAYPALASILRAEGLGGIYKGEHIRQSVFYTQKEPGFAPKVLRLAPGGGVLLLGE